MIHEFYPSEARKEADKKRLQVTVTQTPAENDAQYANYVLKAAKQGISITEYLRRRGVVQAESNKISLQAGDTVFPSIYAEFEKYGKCMIHHVVRNYDDYGEVEWHEPPFIVCVRPFGKPNFINCTTGWVQKTEPENPNEC